MAERDRPPRPLVDSDETVFIPTPGRRRGGAAAEGPPRDPPPTGRDQPPSRRQWSTPPSVDVGINPLLRASAPLLVLAHHLRGARGHQDVPELRRRVIDALQRYEDEVRHEGVSGQTAKQTQYVLCALVDEVVLSTSWGYESTWNTDPLQISLFRRGFSGVGFFDILKEALAYPHGNIDVLELYYVCLSFGYRGLFGRDGDGMARLEELRRRVYRAIVSERGEPISDLSPRWRGVADKRPLVSRYLAWWVVPILAVAAIVLAWTGISYGLNQDSNAVFARINTLPTPEPVKPPPIPESVDEPRPPLPSFLHNLLLTLQPEIDAKLVAVSDEGGTARITLFNKGLFPSGRADVGKTYQPVIEKIARVLVQDGPPGPYVVSGHTDNVPIQTLRFPSNYHLSQARAESVNALLETHGVPPDRLEAEGRADREPIGDNRTTEGKELNRRAEIDIPIPAN